MSKLNLLIILSFISAFAFAQEEDEDGWTELEFDNGTKTKFRYLYDDPDHLLKYYVGAGLGIRFHESEDLPATTLIDAGYRFNNKMWIDARLDYNLLGEVLNFNDYGAFDKKFYDFTALYQYSIFSGNKVKKRQVPIHTEYVGTGNNIYTVDLPRHYARHFMATGGITRFQNPVGLSLDFQGESTESYARLESYTATCLNLGLGLMRSNSLGFESEWSEGHYRGTMKLLAYAMVALNRSDYFVRSSEEASSEPYENFTVPDFNSLGWRMVLQGSRTPYSWSKNFGQLWRAELGFLPGYEEGQRLYFLLGYGVLFGNT